MRSARPKRTKRTVRAPSNTQLLAILALLTLPFAARAQTLPTGRDTAHVAAQKVPLDSVTTGLAQYCVTKLQNQTVKMRAACRNYPKLGANETALLVSTAAPPAPTPTPTPTPTPSPTPVSGSVAAPPERPRVEPPSRDPYPGKPCTRTLAIPDDPNAALSAARGGTILCVSVVDWPMTLTPPKRVAGDTGWIVMRCACTLPAEGIRIDSAAKLPRFIATLNAQPAFEAAAASQGYAFRGIEFTTASTVTLTYALVRMGSPGPEQATVATLPTRFIFEQVIIRGQPAQDMQRCVGLNAGSVAIVDSYLAGCHGKGYDAQAIGGWSGTGPYLIENDYLEGSGENLMLGGSAPAAEGLVAYDVTIRHNHFYTPASWKRVWSKKNLLELKVCHRCLIEGNVLEGSWTDAQTGTGILLKSSTDAPYHAMSTDDITIRNNRMFHVGSGFSVTGRENYDHPEMTALYPEEKTQRVLIENNYVDSLNVGIYTTDDIRTDGTITNLGARFLNLGGPPHGVADVAFNHNTLVTTGAVQQFITLHADPTGPAVDRFDYQGNLVTEGEYGIAGGRFGKAALDSLTVPYTFSNNVIVKGPNNWTYPEGNTVVNSLADAPSTAGASLAAVNAAIAGVVQGAPVTASTPLSTKRIPIKKP